MMEPVAMLVSPLAATPAVPADRGINCKVTSHSGVGLYEVTLDEGIDALECVCIITPSGAAALDATCWVTHTSDTVKVINTMAAGVAADTVPFSALFYRIPSSHP